ncbi:FapA family protein [Hydrogenoanaerobacterium sp.]|uniref:DUF342 domain-containing protein n=1 Tax=Hydrogenoanaerobacterium sp. TaxID=2953763 RepID=UPI00289ED669|nr:FapA family protein [Hydrogenoanaerobacterium sp.]
MSKDEIKNGDIMQSEQETETKSAENAVPQSKTEGSQSFLLSLFNKFSKQNSKQKQNQTVDEVQDEVLSESTVETEETISYENQQEEISEQPGDTAEVADTPSQEEETELEKEPESMPEPVDAEVEILLENNKMAATICVTSPKYGGNEVTHEMLTDALSKNGIVYGINQDRLNDIAENKLYNRLYRIAEGTPAIDGKDGGIKDYFPRERKLNFATREDGSIDFKSLNLIQIIKKDTLICELIPPIDPIDGSDVLGNPFNGKKGKVATLPRGENTVLSEDKTQLLAGCEGNLVFSRERFQVQKTFEVAGNVDNAVGNIDFSGDVIVRGDVFEGFVIKSQGNVTITGMVEGASIYAKGNISISKGMNGMRKGVLESQKSITSKFLENCEIKAKGKIQAESIINSTVFCEDELIVSGKKGAIIGGSFTVYKEIKAKVVGAPSNIPTAIMLGVTPDLIKERNKLAKEIENLKNLDSDIEKNIMYLETLAGKMPLTAERVKQLNQFKIQRPLNQLKQSQLTQRLQEINEIADNVGKSRLICGTIYPCTQITIGKITTTVQNMASNCIYSMSDGEIRASYQ